MDLRWLSEAIDVGQLSVTAAPRLRPAPPLVSGTTTRRAEPVAWGRALDLNGPWQLQVTPDTATLRDLSDDWQSIEVPFAPQSYRGGFKKTQLGNTHFL